MASSISTARRDADGTRERILRAAQAAFSQAGFREAGVREIARRAGTSPALVNRYFGSKEGLFEAALEPLLDAAMLTALPREGFGAALLALLIDRPHDGAHPLTMMMLSASDAGARSVIERLLRVRLAEPLARWLGSTDADDRAGQLLLMTAGLVLYRTVFPLPSLTDPLSAAMRAWLETTFQRILDQESIVPTNR